MSRHELLRQALKRSVQSDGTINVDRFSRAMYKQQGSTGSSVDSGARAAQHRPIDRNAKLPGAAECEDYIVASSELIFSSRPTLEHLDYGQKIDSLLQWYQEIWDTYTTSLNENDRHQLDAMPEQVWSVFITAAELNQAVDPTSVQARPYLVNASTHEVGMIITESVVAEELKNTQSPTFINESQKLLWQGRIKQNERLLKHIVLEQWGTQTMLLKRILDEKSDLQDGKFILRDADTLRQFVPLRQLGIQQLIVNENMTHGLWRKLI